MPTLYSTSQIAAAAGCHPRMVRRFLKRHYPKQHFYRQWWRLETRDYHIAVNALKCAKIACPAQPLHALESGQGFLPLF